MHNLEEYFHEFRDNTIGYNHTFSTTYGIKQLYYFDYIASGRLYKPIEDKLVNAFGPFVGNTHSDSNITGSTMTKAYEFSRERIKKHVNAGNEDILLNVGYGMTAAVNKFQRILGLKIPQKLKHFIVGEEKPVIFVTHMEHHSNHTSWLETIADIVCIEPGKDGLVDLNIVENTVKKYKNRKVKIGTFTACSNVTGILTPYHDMAKIMHQNDGICVIDFAASAPYVNINMHPDDPLKKLDGIFFSPHKFLGGPGSSGILIFDSKLYHNEVPDCPGGGTVHWTNPWGDRRYIEDIESREDGGTPGFLQSIKAALCIELKDKMGVVNMQIREKEMMDILFNKLSNINGLHILAENALNRLGIISFYADNIHYNLLSNILNDKFGIQVRSGCSCAGTYGHYLLKITKDYSKKLTDMMDKGDFSVKPGWVRLSIHPMMKNADIYYAADAIKETFKNINRWKNDYRYDINTNQYINILLKNKVKSSISDLFVL